jgi:excisionase family DNA binding protein
MSPRLSRPAEKQSSSAIDARSARALLKAHEVAELLGVSAAYVWELSRQGRIPTIRIGRARRYRLESILGWLEKIESTGGGET